MGGVVHAVKSVVSKAVSVVTSIVQVVWNDIVVPIVKEVAAIFGIKDELVVQVSKISTKIYAQNVELASTKAIIKAVIEKTKDLNFSHSFFDHYWFQINSTKVSLTSFYRVATHRYFDGIPSATIHGTSIDFTAVDSAVISEFGSFAVVKSVTSDYPSELQHFQYELQVSPYFYKPATGTLTYTDTDTGLTYSNWAIGTIFYNAGNANFEITISRQANLAEFWITGNENVVEGNNATYTIHSTRPVPIGKSITINLIYGGSAPATDYTAVNSVVMPANTSTVDFTVPTVANALIDGNREFTVTLGAIDNTAGIFESVSSKVPSMVSTLIHDDEVLSLLVSDNTVAEGTPTVSIDVSIVNTPTAGFTVDYTTVPGTATAGADYVTTSGTLTFAGTVSEIQSFTVPIITDLVDDSGETFIIQLSNCSDPLVDITSQGIITITDSSAGYPATTTLMSKVLVQPNFVRSQSAIVEYYLSDIDPTGVDWKLWIYGVATNVYPNVDPISNTSTNFELFPIVVLRKNKVSFPNYATTQQKDSMNALLKPLNLKLDDLVANIESNPDIALIKDAYLNVGVNPLDTGQAIAKLLWYLFYPIIVQSPVESNQQKFFLTVEESDIQNAVVWSAQSYSPSVVGNIGPANSYSHNIANDILSVYHQIDTARYDVITISNLSSTAAINYQSHHEVAANKLGDTDFTVPVSWYTLNQLTPKEQMDVYDKIIRMDFYAIQITKIHWYETGGFLKLFQVVLIVVTVISAGTAVAATSGAATAAESTATSTILAVAKQIAINYAISAVVSKIAKLTGNEILATIVGIVASISFAPDGEGFKSLSNFTDAKKLLDLSTNFADNLSKAYVTTATEETKGLIQDISEFNVAAKARLDEIHKAEYTPTLDAEFLAFLRSVDTQSAPAIDGIYEYNALFDYDRLVANYNDNLLKVGVI